VIRTYLVRGEGDRGVITTRPVGPAVEVVRREQWNRNGGGRWQSAWCTTGERWVALTSWADADDRDDELTTEGEAALVEAEQDERDREVACG
jgi:hypothetical protein